MAGVPLRGPSVRSRRGNTRTGSDRKDCGHQSQGQEGGGERHEQHAGPQMQAL